MREAIDRRRTRLAEQEAKVLGCVALDGHLGAPTGQDNALFLLPISQVTDALSNQTLGNQRETTFATDGRLHDTEHGWHTWRSSASLLALVAANPFNFAVASRNVRLDLLSVASSSDPSSSSSTSLHGTASEPAVWSTQ